VLSVGSFFSYVNDARLHEPEAVFYSYITVSSICSTKWQIMLYWIVNGVEERCGIIWDNIPALTWKYWRKPCNSSVRIAGLRVGIWKRDILLRRDGRCLLWCVVTNISGDDHLQVSRIKRWDRCCVCLTNSVRIWPVVMLSLYFGKRSNPITSFFLSRYFI